MAVGDIIVRIGGDVSALQKSLKDAEWSMRRAGRNMKRIGGELTMGLTVPIAGVGIAAVKAAGDFEDSFADIRKTVDATEAQFATMSKQMRGLAKEIPTSVNELNRMAGVAGQLGVGADSIVDFTKVIAMLGDTTDIAGEQAALSISRFMNIMGTAQSDIDRVGSTIVGLGNNFAAMESEIVDNATALAGFGSQINLTESQVLGFATAIAASGGESKAAATAFQKTGQTMQQAVIEGNENLQKFAKVAGVSSKEFQKAFRQDAAGAIVMFLQGLKDVSDRGESTATVLEDLGLADVRLQREFSKLTGNIGDLRAALDQGADEWERNTALTEEAQKRYETFNSQMSILWNNIKDLFITIGNDLLPVIKTMSESVKGIITTLQGMSDGTRQTIMIIGGLVAAIGPLIFAMGAAKVAAASMIGVIGMAAGPLNGFVRYLKFARLATIRFGMGFKSLNMIMRANPIGLIVTALGILIPVIISGYNNSEKFRKIIDSVWGAIKGFGSAMMIVVKNALKPFANTVGIVWDVLNKDWAAASKRLNNTIEENNKKRLSLVQQTAVDLAVAWGTSMVKQAKKQTPEVKKFIDNEIKRIFGRPTNEDLFADALVLAPKGGGKKTTKTTPSPTGGGDKEMADTFKESSSSVWELVTGLSLSNDLISELWKGAERVAGVLEKLPSKVGNITGATEDLAKKQGDIAFNFKSNWEEILDGIEDKLKGFFEFMDKAGSQIASQLFDIWGQALDNKEQRQQEAYEAELERIENSKMSEKAKEEAISNLNKRREKEEKKMAREKAKREKAMAIFQAVIQTAAAVTKVIANPILAGIVAALGAIQIGVIASEPLPALAKGGLAHGPTQAIVGDNVGARTDPEVISPLSKLKQYMGGSQNITLDGEFRIKGTDLVLTLEKAEQVRRRV